MEVERGKWGEITRLLLQQRNNSVCGEKFCVLDLSNSEWEENYTGIEEVREAQSEI